MASPTTRKKVAQKLEHIRALVEEPNAWLPTGDGYMDQLERLMRALRELEALQPSFSVVDSDEPFAARAQRLLAWLSTHPQYKNQGLMPVDDLPAERGKRGLRATKAISKGDTALSVPLDCCISTESADTSIEMGPLTDDARLPFNAGSGGTVIFTLIFHLLIEHSKCLEAGKAVPVDGPIPLPVQTRAQMAAARAAWETAHYGAPLPAPHDEDNCDDEGHGHSHSGGGAGGGGHGHSHGGQPCHGHGNGGSESNSKNSDSSSKNKKKKGSGGGHGHSHGGQPCHGHGSHADEEEEEDEEDAKPIHRTMLTSSLHPWGSQQRAYLSMLPCPADMKTCLYFSPEEIAALGGTHAQYTVAAFIRDAARNYIQFSNLFGLPSEPSSSGGAQSMVAGFEKYYTWAGFKWAISVVMSRQNNLPPSATTASQFEDGPADGSFQPHTQWPAGVRRYGIERTFNLGLIPLFDMTNHQAGPTTSFTTGDGETIIEAARDYEAGSEFTMSYGNRKSDQTLQFQGFVDTTQEGNSGDAASVEVSLGTLTSDVSTSGANPEVDPLLPLRMNLLTSLTVAPEHNAQRHLRTPAVVMMFRRAQQAGTREAKQQWDRVRWSLPFTFAVHSDGSVSHDLLSFLRVGAIRTKAEAGAAIKAADAARREAHLALEEHNKKAAEAKAARKAAAAADSSAGAEDEDEEEDTAPDFELPPLALGVISPESEVRAQRSLVRVLAEAIAAVEASAPAGEGGRKKKGVADDALPSDSPVLAYRALQLRYLRFALGKAQALLEETQKETGAGAAAPLA